jgi:hypothetical protein
MHGRATSSGRSLSRIVLVVYVALAILAAVVGAIRLHQSSEMPGLGAIELVLLALPWSLALGVAPLSHVGLGGMAGLVLAGIVVNGLILRKLAGYAERRLSRGTRGAG